MSSLRNENQLEPFRTNLNKTIGKEYEEWEVPREADAKWSTVAKEAHKHWWELGLLGRRRSMLQ